MTKIIKNIYLSLKNYFISHQSQLLLLLILVILSSYIPQIPYLNKLFSFWVRMGFLWVMTAIIFKQKVRISIIISLVLLVAALFLSIFKEKNITELIGNLIYFLLLLIFGQSFWQYLKEIKTNPK